MLWYCYYHFVWATKNRQPLILPHLENLIFDTIRQKTIELSSHNQIYAINAMPDHIHVAISLYPNISISDWIKRVKGASSHAVNATYPDEEHRFRWQRGYSVHTYGAKVLPFVIGYIKNQKQHHADGNLEVYLEEIALD